MTLEELNAILPSVCQKDTCYKPYAWAWAQNNPLWGHSVVAALLVQDFFGGDIMQVKVAGWASDLMYHYYNRLPDCKDVDLTVAQFDGQRWHTISVPVRVRRTRLSQNPQVKKRYLKLKRRLQKSLKPR